MLVLSRKLSEEIVIAGGIHVKVIEIYGSRVRLGISAPDDVLVMRDELVPQPPVGTTRDRRRELASVAR